MIAGLIQATIVLVVLVCVETIISVVAIRIFEKRLSMFQSAKISAFAFSTSSLFLLACMVISRHMGDLKRLDGLFAMVSFVFGAHLITWKAKKYGIEKVGKLGLGGKVILSFMAVSAVISISVAVWFGIGGV